MRTRIRPVLPLVQVVIAVALTTFNRLRHPSATSPTFQKPDWQFCVALNAPAGLIWDFVTRHQGEWFWEHGLAAMVLEDLFFFLLVALLWYVVSVEIGGKGRSVLTPKTRMRRAADLLAMAFGVAVANMGLQIRRYEFGFVTVYSTLVATPYLVWGLVILAFYGHDLWECFRASPMRRGNGDGRGEKGAKRGEKGTDAFF